MLVAVIGTSLSAYLYSWQSNQEVEEDITEFEMVHLTVTSFEARQIEFYNIKIGSK